MTAAIYDTSQEDQQDIDLVLDEEFLAAIRDIKSDAGFDCLAKHRFEIDRLAEARSAVEPNADTIFWLEDAVRRERDHVVGCAETDRAVDRLSAIHEEIKAEQRSIPNTD